MASQSETVVLRQGTFETASVTSALLRQGTFDTDSQETLRSKSGNIKRGAIAIPDIDNTTSKNEQRVKSIQSASQSDSGELKTIQANLQAVKSENVEATSRHLGNEQLGIPVSSRVKSTDSNKSHISKHSKSESAVESNTARNTGRGRTGSDSSRVSDKSLHIRDERGSENVNINSADQVQHSTDNEVQNNKGINSKPNGAVSDKRKAKTEKEHLRKDSKSDTRSKVNNSENFKTTTQKKLEKGHVKNISNKSNNSDSKTNGKVSVKKEKNATVRNNEVPVNQTTSDNSEEIKSVNSGSDSHNEKRVDIEDNDTTQSIDILPGDTNGSVVIDSEKVDAILSTKASEHNSIHLSKENDPAINLRFTKQSEDKTKTKTKESNVISDPDLNDKPEKSGNTHTERQMTTIGSRDDLTKYEPSSNSAPYSTVLPYRGEKTRSNMASNNGRMEESYEAVYMERDTLLTAEAAYKKRIKQLEDELAQFLKNIEEFREENIRLRTRVDELEGNNGQSGNTVVINTEVDELKREIAKLKAENTEYKGRMKDYLSKQAHLTARNEELVDENQELRARLEGGTDGDDNSADVTKQSDEITDNEEMSKLEDELTSVKGQLEQTKSKEDKLTNEVKKLKELEEKKRKEAEDLENEKLNLKKELDNYKETAKSAEKEKENAKDAEISELKAQIVKLQTENHGANEESMKMKAENLEQAKYVHSLEKQIKSYEKSVTDIETAKLQEIEDVKKRNTKLEQELKSAKKENSGTDEKIKKLESENKTLATQLDQKKTEVAELMTAFKGDHLEDENNKLKDELKKLQGEIRSKDADLENVQESLVQMSLVNSENKTMKSQLEESNKKLEEAVASNESIKAKMKKSTESESDLKEKLNSTKEKNDKLQRELESFNEAKEQIQETESAIAEKDNELAKLKRKCQNYEQDIAKRKKEYEQDFQDLKDELAKEKDDLQRDLDIERGRKKESTARLQRKYDELEEEKLSETSILKKEITDLKRQLGELENAKKAEKEVKELSRELRTVYKKYSEIAEELDQKNVLEQSVFEMTLKTEKMKTQLKLLEKDQREWMIQKDQIDDIENSNKRLTDENIKLKKMLEAKNVPKRIEFLETKQRDADARVQQLEGWVGGLYEETDSSANNNGRYRGNQRNYGSKYGYANNRRQISKPHYNQNSADAIEAYRSNNNFTYRQNRPRSVDDLEVENDTNVSTPTLPSIHSTQSLGYAQIHKRRLEKSTKKRRY